MTLPRGGGKSSGRTQIQDASPEFARLLEAHQQAVRGFLRRLCGQWTEADDLAQDVFVDAWLQQERYDARRPMRSWLFGIAYRKYLQSRYLHRAPSIGELTIELSTARRPPCAPSERR